MKILTRSNKLEEVNFNRIKERLEELVKKFDLKSIDCDKLTQQVVSHIYDGITTHELDDHAAKISASWGSENIEYLRYAAIISVDNLHKDTLDSFVDTVLTLDKECDVLKKDYVDFVKNNRVELDAMIDYSRDFNFDFFGFQTLLKSYLLRVNEFLCERPQHLYMRVACRLYPNDLPKIKKTYDLLSMGYYTHATPTLFNAGTINEQLASCFLLGVEDNIENIFKSYSDSALISKGAGGIGVHIHDIRASGSIIKSTNGRSNGIIPMIQVYNATARYVDQGGGKRKGSIAIYLEPWHADIREFLNLKKNAGDENMKARDIFLALWIPDLFMERVKNNEQWSLMCPHQCKGLSDAYGDEFKKLYEHYEEQKMYRKQVSARDLFKQIMESQIETGVPYMCYKDSVNKKSNQVNLGTIKSSNLCVAPETLILTDRGYFPIKSLNDQFVNVWNGKQFSTVKVQKTNSFAELMKVEFSNGSILECTPYHKFYLKSGLEIQARDLVIGFEMATCTFPVLNCSVVQTLNFISSYLRTNDNVFESKKLEDLLYIKNQLNTISCDGTIFEFKDRFELVLNSYSCAKLRGHGLTINKEFNDTLKVVDIVYTSRHDETYCVNEPLEHKVVFNGILTGNCSEIMEYSSSNEYAVCNLASLNLKKFVINGEFDMNLLNDVTYEAVKNLDRVIDLTNYPTKETKSSNFKNRPIGLGVQGLADVFYLLKMPFESEKARELNSYIFETIYYSSLRASIDLAKEQGSYDSFVGSYFSQGKVQLDLWDTCPTLHYDWDKIREDVKQGVRNSLLTAIMPTASTSQILGNFECIEPPSSNIYLRKTLAGHFTVINKYLVNDLLELGLWNEDMKDKIIYYEGSIQNIDEIPTDIKKLYKTVWEIPQKTLIDLAADRSRFIDQSQSLNLFLDKPDFQKLYNFHMYGWKQGLKTGMYYLRTKPAVNPIKFSLGTKFLKKEEEEECLVCSA